MDSLKPNSNGIVRNVYWGESLTVVTCDFSGLNNPKYIIKETAEYGERRELKIERIKQRYLKEG